MSKIKNQIPVLEILFNSKIRVKVLKFLFRNYPLSVGVQDLARKLQEPVEAVKKELKELERINLIRKSRI